MKAKYDAVVIGASAGAIEALSTVLPHLPAEFPLPIFIVVHLPRDKNSLITSVFQGKCNLRVKEAEDKEPIVGGTIYFAPPDYHLLVEKDGLLSLSSDEQVLHSRPSLDVLFETAADAYRERLIGIILSGANEDGARGLRAVVAYGGRALVQEPTQAYMSTMPQAALEACPSAESLSLKDITSQLMEAVI